MAIRFRLKGLAETFIDYLLCPECGHDGGEEGEEGFHTEYTRVTYDGIIVVAQCEVCGLIFIPGEQRRGVINSERLRLAVERDSESTGRPVFDNQKLVSLEVERLNAERVDKLQ